MPRDRPFQIIWRNDSAMCPLGDFKVSETVAVFSISDLNILYRAWLSVDINTVEFSSIESLSSIASRDALIAVDPSAIVLWRAVVDVEKTRSQPVLMTRFCLRSTRMNAPPPVGSSSKKTPCIRPFDVARIWVSRSVFTSDR